MEEKKNNKGIIWLITILIVLIIGLVGYIVYDKIILENNKDIQEDNRTTTKVENDNAPTDVTEVMKSKLNGLWYNKENNLYFNIENENYFDGEFATDAVIHCQIDNIKKIGEKKYEINTKECTFEEEKRDNIKYEFYYDDNSNEITRNGINYVFISNENDLYNDPVIKTITYNKYNEDTEEYSTYEISNEKNIAKIYTIISSSIPGETTTGVGIDDSITFNYEDGSSEKIILMGEKSFVLENSNIIYSTDENLKKILNECIK